MSLSLAIHALMLGYGEPQHRSTGGAEPLLARLVPPVLSVPAVSESISSSPAPMVSRASAQANNARAGRVATSASERIAKPPAEAASAAVTGATGSLEPGVAIAPAAGAVPVVASRSDAGAIVGEGLDPDGLRGYRVALAREAKRFKRYPARAMEAGQAGTTELRISLGRVGMVEDIRIAKSSGHDLLDQAALTMMRQAAVRAPVPETLRGHSFSVTLPVVFDLRDDQP